MAFREKLTQLQKQWERSTETAGKVPPGLYHARLQEASLAESAAGRLQVHREFLILEGEHEGRVLHDYMQLETEQGPTFIRRWIEQMGYNAPSKADELEETIDAINQEAAELQIKVVHSGDFVNVRIQRVLAVTPQPAKPTVSAKAPVAAAAPAPAPAQGGLFSGKTPPPVQAPVNSQAQAKPTGKVPVKVGKATQAKEEPEAPELVKLIAFAQGQGLEPAVTEASSYDEVVDVITNYSFEVSELLPDEVAMLKAIGATINESK